MIIEISLYFGTIITLSLLSLKEDKKQKTRAKDVLNKKAIRRVNHPETLQHKEYGTAEYHQKYVKMGILTTTSALLTSFLLPAYTPVTTIIFANTSFPTLRVGVKSLKEQNKITTELIFAIVDVMGGVILGNYFILGAGYIIYHFHKKLVIKTKSDFKHKYLTLYDNITDFVCLIKDNHEIMVSVNEIKKGDIVAIKTGDVVHFDGEITDGIAMVDQKKLTGESQPVEKTAGDKVFASTHVISGQIHIRIEKIGRDTAIQNISDILNSTIDAKTFMQSKGEKFGDATSVPILLLGMVAFPIYGLSSSAAVLSCTPGADMVVYSPLANLRYMEKASKNGIIIKDGRALELLDDIDTFIFDKTGTLTNDYIEIGEIYASEGYTKDEVLVFAALAEQQMTHPIAKAIIDKAMKQGLLIPKIEKSNYTIGLGITVYLPDNTKINVGSIRFMKLENIPLPDELNDRIDSMHHDGHTLVLVALNGAIIGAIELQSSIRSEAYELVRCLRGRKVKNICIISGDHENPTKKLAHDLTIENYYFDVLPTQKSDIIREMQEQGGKVCYVGDGINDTLAMKQADVSISVSGASTIAQDVSQIILVNNSLNSLIYLLKISASLNNNLLTSYIFSLLPAIFTAGGVIFLNMGIIPALIFDYAVFLPGIANAMGFFEKKNSK